MPPALWNQPVPKESIILFLHLLSDDWKFLVFNQFDSWAHKEASSIGMGPLCPWWADATLSFHNTVVSVRTWGTRGGGRS